jgi:hypothetical protein
MSQVLVLIMGAFLLWFNNSLDKKLDEPGGVYAVIAIRSVIIIFLVFDICNKILS